MPCRAWSWSNQLLTALAGFDDARGFRQWQHVGRHVRKGERAFSILAPCTKKITARDDDGTETARIAVVGFKSVPVFGYEQTDGEALPDRAESNAFISGLPLVSVAREWGLKVQTFNAQHKGSWGWYRHGESIAVGVENLIVWTHELVHAADDRRGTLTKRHGQQLDNETVAQLGASILLACIGKASESDPGFCWSYIRGYAERNKRSPIAVCEQLLRRTCEAVALILNTADQIAEPVAAGSERAA